MGLIWVWLVDELMRRGWWVSTVWSIGQCREFPMGSTGFWGRSTIGSGVGSGSLSSVFSPRKVKFPVKEKTVVGCFPTLVPPTIKLVAGGIFFFSSPSGRMPVRGFYTTVWRSVVCWFGVMVDPRGVRWYKLSSRDVRSDVVLGRMERRPALVLNSICGASVLLFQTWLWRDQNPKYALTQSIKMGQFNFLFITFFKKHYKYNKKNIIYCYF